MCAGAALPDALVDDAVHVTSQLVATSVRAGRADVEVVVELEPGVVTVRVQNQVGARGESRPAHGRRDIIARLSTSWGYYRAGARHEHWASFRVPQAQYLWA